MAFSENLNFNTNIYGVSEHCKKSYGYLAPVFKPTWCDDLKSAHEVTAKYDSHLDLLYFLI